MSDLVPFDFHGSNVRVVVLDGEPWFVAGDVCYILGYSNPRDAVAKHVRDSQRGTSRIATPSGEQTATVISEGGLYRLLMRARTVLADQFQDWVTDEVLPQIRKTGSYNLPVPRTLPEALRAYAAEVEAHETTKAKVVELEPAAQSWTALADRNGDYSVREAAQILDRDPAISTGQNRLFVYLREIGWVDKSNEPYQPQVDCGRLVRRATGSYTRPDGIEVGTSQPRITAKGLHELHKRLGGSGPLLLAA